MFTYHSGAGAEGYYISKEDWCKAKCPILWPSTKWVSIANGSSNTAKHITALPFFSFSAHVTKADSFDDLPYHSSWVSSRLLIVAQSPSAPKMALPCTMRTMCSSPAKVRPFSLAFVITRVGSTSHCNSTAVKGNYTFLTGKLSEPYAMQTASMTCLPLNWPLPSTGQAIKWMQKRNQHLDWLDALLWSAFLCLAILCEQIVLG